MITLFMIRSALKDLAAFSLGFIDMHGMPRWRDLSILRNAMTANLGSTHLASFHSTPFSCEKWKKQWNSEVRSAQQPSKKCKSYIRYTTREKRADAKKALKNLLYNCGSPNFSFPSEEHANHSSVSSKKDQSKFSDRRAKKAHYNRRKLRKGCSSDDFGDLPETIFQTTIGNRWVSWSFKPWGESFFQSSTTGFEWREQSEWTNRRNKGWETTSESDPDESFVIGSFSDRTILGLPPKGPLKIEDVKNAFRTSALKWHPDKHQGPSQAVAGEKFKLCVEAYKSLCSALSSA